MTLIQFIEMLEVVMDKHRWPMTGHGIKYVRPHFDTRTGNFFGITFDAIRGRKDLFVVNENRQRDLNRWVLDFLNTPPDEVEWQNDDRRQPAEGTV